MEVSTTINEFGLWAGIIATLVVLALAYLLND